MKYTTKSGKELPPEVVEVIEQEQKIQGGYKKQHTSTFGFTWDSSNKINWWKIWNEDDLTEFYKLYPKKDLDSYGNEIVKGEMVQISDYEEYLKDSAPFEFVGIAPKSICKYIVYVNKYNAATSYKFCRKINTNETKKSELQSQMNDLLKQAKEIEAKINEL